MSTRVDTSRQLSYAGLSTAYRLHYEDGSEEGEPVQKLWRRLAPARRDDGASAVEYGLLVALIAVVIAGTVVVLGSTLKDRFDQATCEVANPSTSDSCTSVDSPDDGGDH